MIRGWTEKSIGRVSVCVGKMKEFGSDFHYVPLAESCGKTIRDYYPDAVYYAAGRQALIDLYEQKGWKSLWVPEYFCYEVLASMQRRGVNLKFYPDYPLADERDFYLSLPYEDGDALLRVNYFGLRSVRTNAGIPVPVVEDHTHDLIGDWATGSDAEWCIASLRKTLPIAEGGILWSPKGLKLQKEIELITENSKIASKRWAAMRKKALYLKNVIDDKSEFRTAMLSTEEEFDSMRISALDKETQEYLQEFDIAQWYEKKNNNREILRDALSGMVHILEPDGSGCNPFSLTLLFDTEAERNDFRECLINRSVYPAILWSVPETKCLEAVDFSRRMLSVHCDARYGTEEIKQLQDIIAGI